MTQLVDPGRIKIPDSSDGYILRVSNQNKSDFDLIPVGPGTLDSSSLIANFEEYLNNLEVDVLPLNSDSFDLGQDSFRFNAIFIDDSLNLGNSYIVEDGLISVNGTLLTPIDSSKVLRIVDSNYIESRTPNIDIQGIQGVQGYLGAVGPQGIPGEDLQGPQGLQGIQGDAGPPRELVIKGIQGVQGTDGFSGGGLGLQGPQGVTGLQSIQGVRGDKGTQGIQGPAGANSVQGVQGTTGPSGIQGIEGRAGCPGIQGVQGFQGFQGTIQGFSGYQGSRGLTSTVRGAQGIQGPRGFDGTQTGPGCIQGVRGIRGITSTVVGPKGSLNTSGGTPAECLDQLLDAEAEEVSRSISSAGTSTVGATNLNLHIGAYECYTRGTNCRVVNIGYRAGYRGSADRGARCDVIMIGRCAGVRSTNIFRTQTISIGAEAGSNASSPTAIFTDVAIGFNSAHSWSGGVNIGACAGPSTSSCCVRNSVAIGFGARLFGCRTGAPTCWDEIVGIGALTCINEPCSVAIGFSIRAAQKHPAFQNVHIGACIGSTASFRCGSYQSVHLGSFTGDYGGAICPIRNTSIGHSAGSVYRGARSSCYVNCFWCITSIGSGAGSKICIKSGDVAYRNLTFLGRKRLTTIPINCNAMYLGPSNTTAIRANVTTISALSDCRDKTCIQDIPYGIDFVNQMKPVCFIWNDRDSEGRRGEPDIGFIAQDLLALESDYGSTSITRLVDGPEEKLEANALRTYPIAIKAIQELKKQINRLKEDFQSLKDTTQI